MDAVEAILSRRSIRKYTGDTIPDLVVNEILRAAMSAPSAGNEQPWQFVVIRNRRTLDRIPEVHPHSQMVKEASVAVLVCGDLGREKHKGFWVQDCSAATENMLIAAYSKGLGAVWLGIYPREDRVDGFRRMLEIPEDVIPFALIPIGYPAEKKPKEDRFNIDRIHLEMW